MNDEAFCRRHALTLVKHEWDGFDWVYKCPVGDRSCYDAWAWAGPR